LKEEASCLRIKTNFDRIRKILYNPVNLILIAKIGFAGNSPVLTCQTLLIGLVMPFSGLKPDRMKTKIDPVFVLRGFLQSFEFAN
jgi:hypothetical protein